jgi:hypothetical protein
MPFHFKTIKDISEFTQFKSVLIIPCRFCPAASFSVSSNEPYMEPFRKFLKTDSYERYIRNLKSKFEAKGIKTDVFKSNIIHQFVLCMWTQRRRKKLQKYAKRYEALIVLGCEAAVQTVRDSVNSSDCKVLQGLETEGIMSIQPSINLVGNISLKLESLTPLALQDEQKNEAVLDRV